jgi:hypothetical protein
MAFLVCSQCKGLISTVGGPRSEAVCLACVTGTSDKELESLRTQLADATRKLEEARKDAITEAVRACEKLSRQHYEARVNDIENEQKHYYISSGCDACADAILAIEQGKGGDDASPTDAMELPMPERREHVFKEDKQGIRCTRCGQHAWRADSNCNPNLLD